MLKKKVITQNRAISMAEDLYLKGARKKLRADLRRLKKQEKILAESESVSSAQATALLQERQRLMQEQERLDAFCQEPAPKAKIEEIAAGILRKNGKWATAYAEAEKQSLELAERLHQTQRRLNAAKLWLSRENPRTLYRVIKPKAGSGATPATHSPSVIKSAAAVIADAMLGENEAAQLVARSSGNGLETAKTWTLMTKLDKEALRMKALLRDI